MPYASFRFKLSTDMRCFKALFMGGKIAERIRENICSSMQYLN